MSDPSPLEYNRCQEAVKKLTEFLDHEQDPGEEETVKRTIRERAEQMRAPGALRACWAGAAKVDRATCYNVRERFKRS